MSPVPNPSRISAVRAVGAFVALAAGAAVYLARPGSVVMTSWLPGGLRASLRAALGGGLAVLPAWLRGVLPDLLWAGALGCVLALVWRGEGARQRRAARAWLAAGLALALGWELGQRFGVVPGTFDPLDLLASLVGYVAGGVLGGGLGSVLGGAASRERAAAPSTLSSIPEEVQ